ncbi:unnamed protein product, partial [Symbiodinium necroappetens]
MYKGKGKGKVRDEFLDYCVSRVDPEDRGNLRQHLLPLSRLLATRLRYKDGFFRKMGIDMDQDGYIDLTQVLKLDEFQRWTALDVKEVVQESFSKDKPRFQITERGRRLFIRAFHKRPGVEPEWLRKDRLRERTPSPGPPELPSDPFEVGSDDGVGSVRRNKMAVATPPMCFDLSQEDSADEDVDAEAEPENTLPQDAVLSSLGDEWFRMPLEGSIYAWVCRRQDGSEDGFVEMNPAPWVHVGPGEVDELLGKVMTGSVTVRPCWINESTQEFFFIEEDPEIKWLVLCIASTVMAAASDDLEITVPSTSVEADPSSINHFHVLEDIAAFTNGRLTTQLAKRSFVRNVQISVLVATWAVVLSLPIIIWPWAAVMNHAWCRDLSLPDCNMHPGVCRVEWSLWRFTTECVPSKPSAFLNLWGTMLLQFVFSVYVDLGMTTKFTLQGLFGSCLAYVNVMFLNRVLGFLFAGGAYNGDKFTVSVPIQGESYQTASYAVSYWLPLCNNGEVRFADNAAHCLMNIWLDKLTWSGFLRLGVLWVDFALFVLLCFSVPFDPNPRMFALSTHVSFMMTFVNPSADGFSTEPTYATDYLSMILAASVMSLLCFFLPRLRFTATEAAGDWACDALQATRVLVKHIPSSLDGVLRLKIRTVEQCAVQLLQRLERSLASAWFEGYAYAYWKCRSDYDKKRYQRLKLLVDGLHRCLDRLPAVYSAAALVDTSGAWVSEEAFQLLQQHSERTATKMAQVLRCAFSEASREEPGSSQMGLA